MTTTPSKAAAATAIDAIPLLPPKPEDEFPVALQESLTAAVTTETLNALLSRHADATNPKDAKVIAATANSISIFYLQPVREYWYHPLKQTITIRIVPALPVLPKNADEQMTASWVIDAAPRIQRFASVDEVPVAAYVPPSHWGDWMGVAIFCAFTAVIIARILGVAVVTDWIFTTERRFNMAVAVHCGVLIKRSRDVRQLGDLLQKHWKGGAKGRMLWTMSGWVEGWRAVSRFRYEVAKVGLELAAKEKEDGNGKKEGKKKR